MKRTSILCLCLVSFIQFTFAQDNAFQDALTVYPVSPEAAALGKYGDLPVNLATGKINYTIPLYTIRVGDFEWPIFLSYNYAGLRVEEDPGMTGLGWDLMANGRITQEVRGIPDDLDNPTFKRDYVFPFLNGEFVALSAEEQNQKITTLFERIGTGYGFDSQQDNYHFNAGSLQGSFLYDQNGKAIFPSHKNYHIEGKTITDDNGIKYHFDEVELGEIEVQLNGDSFPRMTKSWLLSKIELPNNQGEILFHYRETSYQNPYTKTVWNQTRTSGFSPRFRTTMNESIIYTRTLEEITFPNGKIELDVSNFQSTQTNGNTLNNIRIYEGENLISGYAFGYSNANRFKKVLKTITKLDHQQNSHPYYSFQYYDEDELNDNIFYTQQDLWGFYNANPNLILIGGDRASNFEKTRIGALKKITYPTGGHSSIGYEQNTILVEEVADEEENLAEIFSYTHNEVYTKRIKINTNENQIVDEIIDLGKTQIVNAFISTTVTPDDAGFGGFAEAFTSLSQEENYALPQNSNYNPLGLNVDFSEEDWLSVESERQADGSIEKTNQMLGFVKDGKIRIYADLSAYAGTSIDLYIQIKYDGSTAAEKYNKPIGGIRVAAVTDAFDDKNTITTQYKYIAENGEDSSGKLLSKNLILSHITSHSEPCESTFGPCVRSGYNFHEYARSQQPFTSYQGNPVLYERVELIKNDGSLGKTVNTYSTAASVPSGFPYPPVVTNDWKKGKLLQQTVFNAQGDIIETTENQYLEVYPYGKGSDTTWGIKGLVIARHHFGQSVDVTNFAAAVYQEYPKIMVLNKSIKTSFLGTTPQVKTTTYAYDTPQVQLKQKQENASSGDTYITEYTYPYNKTDHPLTAQNKLAEVVALTTYLKKAGSESLNKLTVQDKIYKEENDFVVPHKIQTAKGDHPLEERVIFDHYDSYGNVVQSHTAGDDGLYTVTLWGYNGQYPIAKIDNATYTEVHNALGLSEDKEPNEFDLVTIDDLRASKPEWMITTYRHKSLVGVSQITQPNGVSTHYEYDALNRLKAVKAENADNAKQLLEEYTYHYALNR